jgi:hypothetical protein
MPKLLDIIDLLSSRDALEEASVLAALETVEERRGQTKLIGELKKLAVSFRKAQKYGRLRAALLIGAVVGGKQGFGDLETTGVLLAPRDAIKKFGHFLERLQKDCEREPRWAFLRDRLTTYLAFINLLVETESAVLLIRNEARLPIRFWAKQQLALVELCFLREYFNFEFDETLEAMFAQFESPEACASAVSVVVAMANEIRELDAADFGSPALGNLRTQKLQDILAAGHVLSHVNDMAKYLSGFDYSLEAVAGNSGPVFILSPPSPEFEQSIELGYIRGQMGKGKVALDISQAAAASPISLNALAEHFAERFKDKLVELPDRDTSFRRVRIKMPLIPRLGEVLGTGHFSDDEAEMRGLAQDFMLPVRIKGAPPLELTNNLNYEEFLRLYRVLRFFCLVNIALCRPYLASDFTTFANSLIRIAPELGLREMLALSGANEPAITDFLRLVAADTSHLGHYDLQYSPLFKIRPVPMPELPNPVREYVQLPSVIIASSATRNVQMRADIRFHRDGHAFVALVSEQLRHRFPHVVTEKKLKRGELKTEVDIALLCGETLYLVECKHSLSATGPHEMRDLWRDVVKGVGQIERAQEVLQDLARRQAYIGAWFPHLRREAVAELRIRGSVLSSHRLFSGLVIGGVVVRDFASFSRLLEDGFVGMGFGEGGNTIVMKNFRIWEKETIGPSDIENYFSEKSVFHRMYETSMKRQHVYQRFGNLTLVRDTYAYQVDLEEWEQYMEKNGFTRLPDQLAELPLEKTYEALVTEISTAVDTD